MSDASLLESVETLTSVERRADFTAWVDRQLWPRYAPSSLLIGFGVVRGAFLMAPYYVSKEFPRGVARAIGDGPCEVSVPLWSEAMARRGPVLRSVGSAWNQDLLRSAFAEQDFRAVGAAVHVDQRDGSTTYLCITDPGDASLPVPLPLHEAAFRRELLILAPLIHSVLARISHAATREGQLQRLGRLTPRERQILHWVKEGKTNAEISTILGIAFSTIKNHVQNILVKLQVSNRTQASLKCEAVRAFEMMSTNPRGIGVAESAPEGDSRWPPQATHLG